MYFFNIKKLKKDIIEEKLTEIERCKYLFMSVLLYSSVNFIPINEIDRNYTDVIKEIYFYIHEILLFTMIYILFKKYKSKDFLGKFLSLNFVLGIRFLFFIFLFFVFLMILFAIMNKLKILSLPHDFNIENEIFFKVPFSFFLLLYNYRLYIHLKEVVMLENNKNASSLNLTTEPS
ncbi:hypothetical protein [Spirobacillus cienkowskii]|uniref:hypothetical protein n=1 Tax=Spirobacillus cienkowskii TaxID=495820 RepID=UPI0030D31001